LEAPEVMGSAALGVIMFSSWQIEVSVTLKIFEVGTPAGRGICGKAVEEIQVTAILN